MTVRIEDVQTIAKLAELLKKTEAAIKTELTSATATSLMRVETDHGTYHVAADRGESGYTIVQARLREAMALIRDDLRGELRRLGVTA